MDIYTFVAEHFLEALVVLLLVALFFKESLQAWVNAKLGRESVVPDFSKLVTDMTELRAHYNDETTHVLKDMQESLRESRETQLTQCNKLEEMRDILRDVQRNGVRIRS